MDDFDETGLDARSTIGLLRNLRRGQGARRTAQDQTGKKSERERKPAPNHDDDPDAEGNGEEWRAISALIISRDYQPCRAECGMNEICNRANGKPCKRRISRQQARRNCNVLDTFPQQASPFDLVVNRSATKKTATQMSRRSRSTRTRRQMAPKLNLSVRSRGLSGSLR